MMNKNRDMSLPSNINKDLIADKFAEFFTDKVANIRSDLDEKTPSIRNEDSHTAIKPNENTLNQFQQRWLDLLISDWITERISAGEINHTM